MIRITTLAPVAVIGEAAERRVQGGHRDAKWGAGRDVDVDERGEGRRNVGRVVGIGGCASIEGK